ncbi:unnamed protein product, partial [Mesorhabditis spiculigera]
MLLQYRFSAPSALRTSNLPLHFRIQRTHPVVPCTVNVETIDGAPGLRVSSSVPLRAVASGQMCVFYHGRICLGGGEVIRVTRTLHRR